MCLLKKYSSVNNGRLSLDKKSDVQNILLKYIYFLCKCSCFLHKRRNIC